MTDQFEPLNPIEYLNNIGLQKIYEKTHISRQNLDFLFTKQFDKLDKIRALGFVSILQREYKIDLSELKEELLEYYKVEPVKTNIIYSEIEDVKKSKKSIFVILLVLAAAFGGYLFYQQNIKVEQNSAVETPSKKSSDVILKAVEKEKVEFESKQEEINKTIVKKDEKVTSLLAPIVLEPIKITPRKKVWLGYIDLDTYKKVQKTTTQTFELDPEKRWLMVFGHGLVDVSQGDEVLDFSSRKKLYLFYEDGVLKEIGKKEFKSLNRGKMW